MRHVLIAAALLGVLPAAAADFSGRVELLEKGKPSADKTLARAGRKSRT